MQRPVAMSLKKSVSEVDSSEQLLIAAMVKLILHKDTMPEVTAWMNDDHSNSKPRYFLAVHSYYIYYS